MSRPNLDRDFCLVLADYGPKGRAFVETDPADATFERAVRDIFEGQVENPIAVVQFNLQGHARYMTEDVARAVAERVWQNGGPPRDELRRFLDVHGLAYPTAPADELA